ncbi:hypothetical protein BD289DRAFT_424611 [Coniella lustricola]|uniref:Ubiquitin-like domain-containing protein n=1 Tax=Coniella lustricola TaxID=2025994 RepID=A0A2T3AI46_9PEZI|nr:hypothetical protein BD289DRAFT_424611 [Coniella lustricola]
MAVMHDIYHCTCVSCTAAFGQQLANVLRPWNEVIDRHEFFDLTFSTIQSTNSTLEQLEGLLLVAPSSQEGVATPSPVFTTAGQETIESLSQKCNIIMKAIILLLQKVPEDKKSEDVEKPVDNASKQTNATKTDNANPKAQDNEKKAADSNSSLLTGTVPDLSSIKTLGMLRNFSKRHRWLEARLFYCAEQLAWVNKSLVLHLQMGRLAQLQNSTQAHREKGSFETELVSRGVISLLLQAHKKYTKIEAKEQESRGRRLARRRANTVSSSSLRSAASSDASASTIVDERQSASANATVNKIGISETETNTTLRSASLLPASPATDGNFTSNDTTTITKKSKGSLMSWFRRESSMQPVTPVQNSSAVRSVSWLPRLTFRTKQLQESISDFTIDWADRIFGAADIFSDDCESKTLEAWVSTGRPGIGPTKIPFGHRRLQMGLRRSGTLLLQDSANHKSLRSANAAKSTWRRFVDGGVASQAVLEDVVQAANRLQSRERICLTFDEYISESTKFMIVFFAIQPEKEPISITIVAGDTITIPYLIAKDWANMKHLIHQAIRNKDAGRETFHHIFEDHFHIFNTTTNTMIPPSIWSTAVQPGGKYRIVLWFSEESPLRVPMRYVSLDALNPKAQLRSQDKLQETLNLVHRNRLDQSLASGPSTLGPAAVGVASAPPRPEPDWPFLNGPGGGSFPRPVHMPMPMHNYARPPLPCPPFVQAPAPRQIVHVSRSPGKAASTSSYSSRGFYRSKYDMAEHEWEELKFVDYVLEKKKLVHVTVGQLLTTSTTMVDVGDEECSDGWAYEDYNGRRGYDSDGTSSSGSSSIEDD